MKASDVIELYDQYVLPTSTRSRHVFTWGKGSWLKDIHGKEYLDFFPGYAVSGLGHCPPPVVRAIRTQAGKLLHVSNNYHHPGQARLAKAIVETSFESKVFCANSGAAAN